MSYTRLSIGTAKNRTATAALVFIGWLTRMGRLVCRWYDAACGGASTPAVSTAQNLQAAANDPAFTDEDGAVFTLDNLRGRPLLINFWASWCHVLPKCRLCKRPLNSTDVLLISLDRGGVKGVASIARMA